MWEDDIINLANTSAKPLVLREPLTWREKSACRGSETSKFFADRGGRVLTREAKLVCATCTVRISCLNFAIDNDERGIWGGTTEGERKRMIRGAA